MGGEQVKYMGAADGRTGPIRTTSQLAAEAFFERYPDADRCKVSEGTEPFTGFFTTKLKDVKEYHRG